MKKPSLSIAIPAHNESANIIQLLESIAFQRQTNYRLQKVVVACDKCTDNTEKLVTTFARKHHKVECWNDNRRRGKAGRLNQFYSHATSDYVLTLDADIVLKDHRTISSMMKVMLENSKLVVVSAVLDALPEVTIIGKASRKYFTIWNDVVTTFNAGANIHTLFGSASLIKTPFAQHIHYPKGTISDQNYLYTICSIQHPKGYALAHKAHVWFRVVNTWKECRLQGTRAIRYDKHDLVTKFGTQYAAYYIIPFTHKLKVVVYHALHDFPSTLAAVLLSVCVRLFPYQDIAIQNETWTTVTSSKTLKLH